MRKKRCLGITLIIILSIFIAMIGLIKFNFDDKIDRSVLESNFKLINDECNDVYKDIEGSKVKYLELLKTEKDSFKRGIYCSALVQIYTLESEYEKVVQYANEAVENYNKVEGGEYYSIFEKEYLAWSMLNMEKYTESFIAATELLELVSIHGEELLNEDEIIRTEQLVYSIFIRIYTKFDILDKAEIYYDKLYEMDTTGNFKSVNSKLNYVIKINNAELMKEYSEEYYEIIVELDKQTNNNVADSALLDVGIANIELGNYDEAIVQIKKAEDYYTRTGDEESLVRALHAKGKYYKGINDIELANQYYKESIDLVANIKDYDYEKLLVEEYIKFIEENNIEENSDNYYKKYFELSKTLDKDVDVTDLLSQIISMNNELNNTRVILLENSVYRNRVSTTLACIIIILLFIIIVRGYFLVKEKNKAKMMLEKIANTDYLTDVCTRSYGEKMLLNELYNNHQFAISIIDIDNFKNINDTYGHNFGDIILKGITNELKNHIDKSDIIYRYGGEEFVIAFKNKSKEEAKVILDKIREDVYSIMFEDAIQVSFSAGIVELEKDNIDLSIKKADKLLYKAKKSGKNRVEI